MLLIHRTEYCLNYRRNTQLRISDLLISNSASKSDAYATLRIGQNRSNYKAEPNRAFSQITLHSIICSVEHRNFEVGHQHGSHERVRTLKWETNMVAMSMSEL